MECDVQVSEAPPGVGLVEKVSADMDVAEGQGFEGVIVKDEAGTEVVSRAVVCCRVIEASFGGESRFTDINFYVKVLYCLIVWDGGAQDGGSGN